MPCHANARRASCARREGDGSVPPGAPAVPPASRIVAHQEAVGCQGSRRHVTGRACLAHSPRQGRRTRTGGDRPGRSHHDRQHRAGTRPERPARRPAAQHPPIHRPPGAHPTVPAAAGLAAAHPGGPAPRRRRRRRPRRPRRPAGRRPVHVLPGCPRARLQQAYGGPPRTSPRRAGRRSSDPSPGHLPVAGSRRSRRRGIRSAGRHCSPSPSWSWPSSGSASPGR